MIYKTFIYGTLATYFYEINKYSNSYLTMAIFVKTYVT